MGKVVGMLMGRILEIAFAGGEKDPRKVLEAALERRGSGVTPLGVAMAQEGGFERDTQAMPAAAAGRGGGRVALEEAGVARGIGERPEGPRELPRPPPLPRPSPASGTASAAAFALVCLVLRDGRSPCPPRSAASRLWSAAYGIFTSHGRPARGSTISS